MRTSTASGTFVHEALLYRGDTEYLAGTVPFVLDALRRARPVLVAVPGDRLALLRGALGADADRVEFTDMTRAGRNPGRILPWVLGGFFSSHGGGPRVIGELIWPGRDGSEYPGCVIHEALINLAFAGRPGTVLCPYDAAALDVAVLADAATTHPVLVERSGRRRSRSYQEPERVVARFNRPPPAVRSAPLLRFDPADAPSPLLSEARRFAAEQAAAAGLDADRIADLEVVVSELATNTLRYGRGAGELRVWARPGELLCEVRDGGHITDPLAGRLLPDPESDRGRGLLLVNYLCDLVETYSSAAGTVVRGHLRH